MVAKWLSGSGCRFGWGVGLVGMDVLDGWRSSKRKGQFWGEFGPPHSNERVFVVKSFSAVRGGDALLPK